jgi:hypothetical protein
MSDHLVTANLRCPDAPHDLANAIHDPDFRWDLERWLTARVGAECWDGLVYDSTEDPALEPPPTSIGDLVERSADSFLVIKLDDR